MPAVIQSILQADDQELAYITTDNRAFYRSPTGVWSYEFAGAQSIALTYGSSLRIGVLDTGGTIWVKEGSPDAAWTLEIGTAVQGLISGQRISALVGNTLYTKEGGLSASWTLEADGVASSILQGNMIGVLATDGSGYLKNGGLSDKWFSIGSDLSQIDLRPTGLRAGYTAYYLLARAYSSGELTLTYDARNPEYRTALRNVVQVVVNQSPPTIFYEGQWVQLQVAALTAEGEFYVQYADPNGPPNQPFRREATAATYISLLGNTLGYVDDAGGVFFRTLPRSEYTLVANRNSAPERIAHESYHLLPRQRGRPEVHRAAPPTAETDREFRSRDASGGSGGA